MNKTDYFEGAKQLIRESYKSSVIKLKFWKISFVCCVLVIIVQLCTIIYQMNSGHNYVYVARVAPGEQVENMTLIASHVEPGDTEKIHFIKHYIENLMSSSMDPVLTRSNWLLDYDVSGSQAKQALNHYIDSNDRVALVGRSISTVHINTYNVVSKNTYQLTWDVKSYDIQSKKKKTEEWSGVFTLSVNRKERVREEILNNPFGLKMDFFSLNKI